jgi:hypothetical protein
MRCSGDGFEILAELWRSERVTASHLTGIERLVTLASGGPVMLTCPVSMGHLTSLMTFIALSATKIVLAASQIRRNR